MPASASLTTNTSTCIACSVKIMSRMLSPFFLEEVLTSRFRTSAPSRLAARSNDARVRVLGSKNRLATVRPARALLRAGSESAGVTYPSASSRMLTSMSRSKPFNVKRCRRLPSGFSCRLASSSRIWSGSAAFIGPHSTSYRTSGLDQFALFAISDRYRSAIMTAAAASTSSREMRPRAPFCRASFKTRSASIDV